MLRLFAFFYCLCLSANLSGQEGIQTKNELTVEDLVKNIFIKGNCKNVSNITAIGNEAISIGQFYNGENILNINDGLILSTGSINLASGPNADNESGFAFNIESNDPDLGQSATGNLFDITGIEFDFVPLADNVSFRYVFASEEYCEFVGTQFNDVFVFFVSGPGINGNFDNNAINVASIITLDGTEEIVSINTINHLENETFYVSNITTTDAQNCEISYNPVYQDLIEYDGFTILLTASFQVIPCETYHIRLVLGDVGDAILDSAVFLEANSFDLGEKVQIRAEVPGSDEAIAYEGCVDGQFVFTRSPSSNINEDCTIEYTISSESEAINGVDFEEIPLSVTIPAGDTNFILPIIILEDNIAEGPESLKLEFVYNCDCLDPVISELIIKETSDLSVNFEEILVCEDQVFKLTPEIIGGVPPFNFLWETGSTSEILEASISTPTQFALTISDFCGISSIDTVNIGIQDIPIATLTGEYDLCETIITGIPIQLEGNPPWTIEYSINGMEQIAIENIIVNPFYLNTPSEGIYELIAFNDAYCEGNAVGSAVVEYSTFDVSTTLVPPSCLYNSDGSIEITQLDAVTPFSVEWSIETENDFFIEKLQEGTYTLSIIDGNGCVYEESIELIASSNNINDCLPIYIPNSFSPNDDGINDIFSIYAAPLNRIEKIVSFQVFDRWGALIFEQNDFIPDNGTTGWKGDYKGKPLDTGIYVFKVLIAFEDNTTLLISGDVILLR
jgi:gliding motility-associated-like protein